MEVSGSLLARLNTPTVAFTAITDNVDNFVEPEPSWNNSCLNPRNRVEIISPPKTSTWRIDGSARFGTQLFAIPTMFLPTLQPLRIDTYIPEHSQNPAHLNECLDSADAVMLRDERVAHLGISCHIARALDYWSSRQANFEAAFKNLPFGSRVVVKNIHQEVEKMDIVIHSDYDFERQLLSLKALRSMWELAEDQMPEILDLSALELRQQPHESISLVQIPKHRGSELMVFKSVTDDLKHMYHELKIRLALPPHENIAGRPLYIVTKKCLFGGKKGVCGFVMEYHPLGSLRSVLPTRQMKKTLTLQNQFKWALQIVSSLIHLNDSAKIFYPDLRPENLLLDKDNNIVVVDFEQRGGWHPCGPPEVCYLKYLQTLCTPTTTPATHPAAKYETLLLEHASPELLRSTRSKSYNNPEQGYALPWLVLDNQERESGQVYMLGLLLWCIFEGRNEVANDIFTSLPYQTDQEFPEFVHSPPVMRACIRECTFGAPQWEGRWPLGTYREGTRIYSRARGTSIARGKETDMAREVFEANQEWWKGQARRMEEYIDFRRSKKQLVDDGSEKGRIRELVDPSGSTSRPNLRQVEEMLKRARAESLEVEI